MIHRSIAVLLVSFLFLVASTLTHHQIGTITINTARAAEATTLTKTTPKRTTKTRNENEEGPSCAADSPRSEKTCFVQCKLGQAATCVETEPPICKCH
jgi:hypothetical protein